jgi:hypothetical protein
MTGAPTGRAAWLAVAAAALGSGYLVVCLVAASAAPVATALLLSLLAAEIWAEVSR